MQSRFTLFSFDELSYFLFHKGLKSFQSQALLAMVSLAKHESPTVNTTIKLIASNLKLFKTLNGNQNKALLLFKMNIKSKKSKNEKQKRKMRIAKGNGFNHGWNWQ